MERMNFYICRSEMEPKYKLDPDTVECPICKVLLCPPVFQCRNRHIACSNCREMLRRKPYLDYRSIPFDYSRCLVVEKIIESLLISCRYASHGCTAMVKLERKEEHEQALCKHRPIQCPVTNCNHECLYLQMPKHFRSHVKPDHIIELDSGNRTARFRMDDPYVLVQSDEGLFLVHHLKKKLLIRGDFFFCTTFGSSSKTYRLKAQLVEESSSFSMKTSALNNQESRETWLMNDFLFVPNMNRIENRQFHMKLRLLP